MNTRTCTKCKVPKETSSFGRQDARGSLHSHCKACVSGASRQHYLHTSSVGRRYTGSFDSTTYYARKNKDFREYLASLKKKPCIDCLHSFPPNCMEFDHVKEGKKMNVAQMRHAAKEKLSERVAA